MRNKRFIAGAIDFLIAAIIQSILMLIFIMRPLVTQQIDMNRVIVLNLIITLVSMSYLIIRDILGSRSIGKKILKLKILDIKTGNSANWAARLIRNITWLLGPLEIVLILVTGNRMGDIIAQTKVEAEKQS
jgi:uncharacterized RDD family membrane protein YckC